MVAAYIEAAQRQTAPPTVKQQMASIRMLFSWLTEQVYHYRVIDTEAGIRIFETKHTHQDRKSAVERNSMSLKSKLFRGDRKLERCLVEDNAHVTLGAAGDHVSKIHTALLVLDNISVAVSELRAKQ